MLSENCMVVYVYQVEVFLREQLLQRVTDKRDIQTRSSATLAAFIVSKAMETNQFSLITSDE